MAGLTLTWEMIVANVTWAGVVSLALAHQRLKALGLGGSKCGIGSFDTDVSSTAVSALLICGV